MRTRSVYKQHALLTMINLKRIDMYKQAQLLGFTHAQVIKCSQELDSLLNQYQEGTFSYNEVV